MQQETMWDVGFTRALPADIYMTHIKMRVCVCVRTEENRRSFELVVLVLTECTIDKKDINFQLI